MRGRGVPLQGLRGRKTYERQVALVLGLTAHTMETARLVQDLAAREGLSVTTMPLVRASLESAVTAVWIAQVEDAAEAFGHQHAKQEILLFDQFRATGDPTWTHLLEAMEPRSYDFGATTSHHQAKHFHSRCQDLQGGMTIYALYRALSGWSHASVRVADEFLLHTNRRDDGNTTFALRPKASPFEGQDTWMFVSALSALWASRAVNYLTRDHARRSLLRRAARELGVPLDLKPSQAPNKRRPRKKGQSGA
ncbi:DUF5677 domain-containing protein [Arthrobacter sulfonylureivorans]|uniref:DUF5677 domain-containing protein n=1 Tax=Arthrobacter sulfonylureivorans TaxID=2486855 RepID=UPI003BB0FF89